MEEQEIEEEYIMPTTSTSTMSDPELLLLSNSQEITLSILSLISAVLSIMGSSMIIYLSLIKKSTNNRKTPYKRIMAALSSCDIILSLTYGISPFLLKSSTTTSSSQSSTTTTTTTCQVLGFFTQFSFAVIWYNMFLSYYYFLTVRFANTITQEIIAKRFEPVCHIVSIGFSLITAIWGLIANYYSQSTLGQQQCWITIQSYPIGLLFGGLPVLITFASSISNNLIIYFYIKRTTTLLPSGRKSTSAATSSNNVNSNNTNIIGNNFAHSNSNTNLTNTSSMSTIGSSVQQLHRVNTIATQSFLYCASFMICFSWFLIIKIIECINEKDASTTITANQIFPILVLESMFLPLQGIFNLIIYSRPNYIRTKHEFPTKSAYWIIQRCWFGPPSTPFGRLPVNVADQSLLAVNYYNYRSSTSHHNNQRRPSMGGIVGISSSSLSGGIGVGGGGSGHGGGHHGGGSFPYYNSSSTSWANNVNQIRARAASQFTAVFSTKDPLRQDYHTRHQQHTYYGNSNNTESHNNQEHANTTTTTTTNTTTDHDSGGGDDGSTVGVESAPNNNNNNSNGNNNQKAVSLPSSQDGSSLPDEEHYHPPQEMISDDDDYEYEYDDDDDLNNNNTMDTDDDDDDLED